MDRITKAFVVASLAWFAAAAVLGVWLATTNAPEWARFAHVHFNLLGFMAMMIYGIGYFILPRFNARPLRWPGLVPVHFWISNIGLAGMALTYVERPSTGFNLFSGLSGLGVLLFVVNLAATILAPAPGEESAAATAPAAPRPAAPAPPPAPASPPAAPAITADTRVGEILTRWPDSWRLLVEGGLTPLGDPAHREKVKGVPVTLGMACTNHGVDLDAMLRRLNAALAPTPAAGPAPRRIGPNDVIGEVLRSHPATAEVFRRSYGAACFSCPGQATETVRQSALMHNAKEAELLRELNEAAGL
jgi:lipid-A-disaccharide synthase-like uncharacterized protein